MYADSRGRAASAGDSRRGSLSGAAVQGNVIMALFGCRWQPVASALAGTVPATAMYFMARLFVAMHFVAMSAFGGQAFAQGRSHRPTAIGKSAATSRLARSEISAC